MFEPNGTDTNNTFGYALAAAGDFDHDGIADFLIGAPQEYDESKRITSGRCHAYSGRPPYHVLLSAVPPFPAVGGGSWFGSAIAALGDINGDGTPDLLVGAYLENGAYLYSGVDGSLLRMHILPPEQGAWFGRGVCSIPDVNGDGIADYGISRARRAYVYDGATGELLYSVASQFNSDCCEYFGETMIGLDDIDGDGRGDFAVGAPREYHEDQRYAGHVHVFSGATGAFIRVLFHNLPTSRFLGFSMARMPDCDGDGVNDIIAGAPYEYSPSHPESNAGRAFAFSGATGALLLNLASPRREWGAEFGHSVGGIPDVDGDGFGDVVVGAPWETPPTGCPGLGNCGAAYVFSGATGRIIRELSSPNPQVDWGHFGWTVAGIDPGPPPGRRGRVLVHAPESPNGRTYLFYTCPADFNGSGETNADDFFLFIQRFLENAPSADFNADGRIDSRDFFDFITSFFAGC